VPVPPQKLIDALVAFQNIHGDTLYPQIYIPNYEDLKSKGKLGVASPIIIPYAYQEEANDEYIGYQLDSRGNYVQLPSKISESYADDNEVWVISLNEVVNRVALPQDDQEIEGGTGIQSYLDGYIQKITPWIWLEKWIGGKMEMCIKTIRTTGNGFYPATSIPADVFPCTRYSSNDKGHLIKQIKKSELFLEFTADYLIQEDWEDQSFYNQGTALHYAIFERDKWPAPVRQAVTSLNVGSPPEQRFIGFRSSELQFNSGVIYSNFF
jgi:hypothetical protein